MEQLQKLQPTVVKQLMTLYEKQRIAHAYIFEGEKGTGKSDIAHFFMKLLLCENVMNSVPCETCRHCKRIDSGNHPTVIEIEPDGQFIKIDQIRDLMSELNMTRIEAGKKFYVIHNAERLNPSAANTLLKFLEEPTSDIVAILITSQLQAILPTIRSRCQLIKFASIPQKLLIERLQEKGVTNSMASTVSIVTNELEAALALSEQEQFAYARKTVLKLIEMIQSNVQDAMLFVHDQWIPSFKEREEIEQALDLLLYAYRDVVAVKANVEVLLTYPDMRKLWETIALAKTYEALSSNMQSILKARQQLQRNMNRTLLMEQLMLDLQEGYTFV